MLLLKLFFTFFKLGLVSFGGGYAMIPLIEYEIQSHEWLTIYELTDIIAIAGVSPGPIATNVAVIIGYKLAGVTGAVISLLAVSTPSFIIVILIALFFMKIQQHTITQSVFYGLRPVITGLIANAGIKFALFNQIIGFDFHITGILIMLIGLSLLIFTKLHPVLLILLSGIAGIIVHV